MMMLSRLKHDLTMAEAARIPGGSRVDHLPYLWYDSPNIHFCTIKDFRELCIAVGAEMEKAVAFNPWGSPLRLNAPWWFWNMLGEQAVFRLSRGKKGRVASSE